MTSPWTAHRRVVSAATVLCGAAALVAVVSSPADASVTQTGSCVDGGGARWNVKAVWGAPYRAADGTTKVSLDQAGWTTTRAGSVPTDARIRSYTAAGTLVQDRTWTGSLDYQRGTVYKSLNPVNPPSAPGGTKLKLTVGVKGDGKPSCSVTLLQPTAPIPSPTPTSAAPTPTPSATVSAQATPTPVPTPRPTTATPTTPAPTTTPAPSLSDRYEADVLAATNGERAKLGLTALSAQACVDSYAEAQALRMVERGAIYHQDLSAILTACRLSTVGENVAYGYSSGQAVTDAWMASPGHRANILKPEYRVIGIGAAQDAQGRWYAAQVFGTAR